MTEPTDDKSPRLLEGLRELEKIALIDKPLIRAAIERIKELEAQLPPIEQTWITCPATGKQCNDFCDPGKGDWCSASGASFAPSAREETGTVAVTVEFIEVAKAMAEAVRWVLQDANYKAPEQIGPVAERWIDRLRGVEDTADAKLNRTPGVGQEHGNLTPRTEREPT